MSITIISPICRRAGRLKDAVVNDRVRRRRRNQRAGETAQFRVGPLTENRSTQPSGHPILLTAGNGEHFIFSARPCCDIVARFAPWRSVADEFDDGCKDYGWMSPMTSR